MSEFIYIADSDFLMHHGIKGQKWGERRFQNEDGTLTPEGKDRYAQYTKDFGEKTAKRLMRYHKRGLNSKEALRKEYKRRKTSSTVAPLAGAFGGAAVGAIGGIATSNALTNRRGNQQILGRYKGITVTGPKKTYNPLNAGNWGGIIGATVGAIGSTAINDIGNGYKFGDLSDIGLRSFYRKMSKYHDE